MATNQYINKVNLIDGTPLIDLTDATATADKILSPYTAYGATGEKLTGTAEQRTVGGTLTDTSTTSLSEAAASISFTGLADEPTSFVVTSNANLATGASPYKTATVVYDGTNLHGQTIRNTSDAQVTYDGSGFSMSYSSGTLTITGTNANFQANRYSLVYTYRGTTTINLWRPVYVLHAYFSGTDVLTAYETDRTIYIPCKPNTTYTVKRKARGERYQVAYITSPTITTGVPIYGRKYASSQEDKLNLTITTGADATFVVCYMWDYDSEPNTTPEQALEDVMITEGGVVDTYIPPYITNVYTSSVQAGSNATSITFSNLKDEPEYFSCIFKSNFGTTSGSQRVIEVVYDGTNTYGLEMDSGAKYSNTHWTHTYSEGSLTITSSGSNAGGYFYTPGNYQLTYAFGSDKKLQNKTVTPTNQRQTIVADYEYDALSQVVVNEISTDYMHLVTSGDLHITSTDTADYYIDLNGDEQPYSTWTMTDYIPVTAGKWYQIEGYYLGNYNSFYNSSKQFVSTFSKVGDASDNGRAYVIIPDGVAYMRFSAKTTDIVTLHVYETDSRVPSGTLSVTTNGIKDVSLYEYANVSVSGSLSGVNIPVFTLYWDDNWSGVESVTCNKTYSECISFLNNYHISAVYVESKETGSETIEEAYSGNITGVVSGGTYNGDRIVYAVGGFDILGDITYYDDGTITFTKPSSKKKTSSDLTANGATVTVPAGIYTSSATKTIASGSATPAASISSTGATVSTGTNTLTLSKTVSNTPQVSAGYVSSGTAGNSSVSLTASVNTRSSSDLTASGATVTAPAGYYASQATKSVASGSVTAPSSISGTSATVSTGTNTLTLTKTVSVTPSVTTQGYITSGTAGNSSVSLTASVTTKGATTYNTSSSDQTIASGTYLTGTQTIKAVTVSGLSADKILSGTTVKIGDANDDDRIASVSGSVTFQTIYTGSGTPSSSTGVNGDIYIKTS